MLLILEGPEGAGKSTIAKMVTDVWDTRNPPVYVHHVRGDSNPTRIETDLKEAEDNPETLYIFDRWWPSALVYRPHDGHANLLPLDPWLLEQKYGKRADEQGLRYLVTRPVQKLIENRGEDAVDIDPAHELLMYQMLCSPMWRRTTLKTFDVIDFEAEMRWRWG